MSTRAVTLKTNASNARAQMCDETVGHDDEPPAETRSAPAQPAQPFLLLCLRRRNDGTPVDPALRPEAPARPSSVSLSTQQQPLHVPAIRADASTVAGHVTASAEQEHVANLFASASPSHAIAACQPLMSRPVEVRPPLIIMPAAAAALNVSAAAARATTADVLRAPPGTSVPVKSAALPVAPPPPQPAGGVSRDVQHAVESLMVLQSLQALG